MVPFEAYKVAHLFGVFMLVSGVVSLAVFYSTGTGREHPARRLAAATHGFGLLIALVAGFGMIARGGYSLGQPWLIGKLIIWVLLGGIIAFAKRMPKKAGLVTLVTLVLAGLAAFFAVYKPGA